MSDSKVAEILQKYGEDPKQSTWSVQGQKVILHKALERIAAKAAIVFDPPQVLRAETDEAVLIVTGSRPGGVKEWSIGEAKIGSNYRVSGKQAAYPYAMAEKRAKDRVILKLIELHGYAYSEDEADDFKDGRPRLVEAEPEPELHAGPLLNDLGAIKVNGEEVSSPSRRMSAYAARKDGRWNTLVTSLRACSTMEALDNWTDIHVGDLEELPAGWLNELREEWKARAREIKVRG